MLDFWRFKVLAHLQKPKGRTAQIERCNRYQIPNSATTTFRLKSFGRKFYHNRSPLSSNYIGIDQKNILWSTDHQGKLCSRALWSLDNINNTHLFCPENLKLGSSSVTPELPPY